MKRESENRPARIPKKTSGKRRVTPVFPNPQASRFFGISDAFLIDVDRLLRVDKKRPQVVTELFEEKLLKDMPAQLEKLSSLPASEKVLRWKACKGFNETSDPKLHYRDISLKILKAILGGADWIVRIPVSDEKVLEALMSERDLNPDRIHLGFRYCLSSGGEWDAQLPEQLEKAHGYGFKVYAILDYNQPDAKYVQAALELSVDQTRINDLQVDILPDSTWKKEPEAEDGKESPVPAQEAIARNIFRGFRMGSSGEARISINYTPESGYRAWWTAQFGGGDADPIATFSECFGKPADHWSAEEKEQLFYLLGEVSNTLKASVERAYFLHKIKLLTPKKEEEQDPSFAKACKAMWQIEKTQVYRLIRAGKFLHLLEKEDVPKEDWPTRETHIRNLIESGLSAKDQVECWKGIKRQYPEGRLIARHINQDVDAALIEKGHPPVGNRSVGPQKRILLSLDSMILKVKKQFPDEDNQAQCFVDACKGFAEYIRKNEESDIESSSEGKAAQPKRKRKLVAQEETPATGESDTVEAVETEAGEGNEAPTEEEIATTSVFPDVAAAADETTPLTDDPNSLFS